MATCQECKKWVCWLDIIEYDPPWIGDKKKVCETCYSELKEKEGSV